MPISILSKISGLETKYQNRVGSAMYPIRHDLSDTFWRVFRGVSRGSVRVSGISCFPDTSASHVQAMGKTQTAPQSHCATLRRSLDLPSVDSGPQLVAASTFHGIQGQPHHATGNNHAARD